jgi:hypothetical protein
MGTSREGPARVRAHAAATASSTDAPAAPTVIAGRAVTGKTDRKTASRVALPAVWNAMASPAVIPAAHTARRPAVSTERLPDEELDRPVNTSVTATV